MPKNVFKDGDHMKPFIITFGSFLNHNRNHPDEKKFPSPEMFGLGTDTHTLKWELKGNFPHLWLFKLQLAVHK